MLKGVSIIFLIGHKELETTSGISVISNLVANTYSLVISDNNGCVDTASIVVTQPLNAIDLSVSYTNETCRRRWYSNSFRTRWNTTYLYNWTMTTTNLFLSTRH